MIPITILIDNPQEQYCPGQSIVGRVLCSVHNVCFADVTIKLVGEELTYYTISHKSWKSYFLETKDVILHSGELNSSNSEFAFKVTLPRRIPSTYVGKYGHVKYVLKVWLVGFGEDRQEAEREFMVFSPIDLDDMVNLWLVPSTHSDELQVQRWLCIREKIEMDVKLERETFVVDDLVNVLVMVTNNSHVSISAVEVKLLVRTQAKVATPRQEFVNCYELLAADKDFGVGTYSDKNVSFSLKIPSTAQIPNFEKCSLFTQRCLLEVRAVFSNSSKPDLKIEIGLVLGHLPLDGNDVFSKTISYPVIKGIKGKTYLPDPVIIRPLPYGIKSDLHTGSPTLISPHISESHPAETPKRYLTENMSSYPLSPHKTNLPYGADNFTPAGSYPRALPTKMPILPYPSVNSCPYPTEKNSSATNCYPKEQPRKPGPHAKIAVHSGLPIKMPVPPASISKSFEKDNPPYPPEVSKDTRLSMKMPTPYDYTKTSYKTENIPHSIISNPPYPKEVSSEDTRLPSRMPMPYFSFEDRSSPFSSIKNPPYPKEVSSKDAGLPSKMPMPYSSFEDRSSPFSSIKNPLYPKEVSSKDAGLPTKMPVPYDTTHSSSENNTSQSRLESINSELHRNISGPPYLHSAPISEGSCAYPPTCTSQPPYPITQSFCDSKGTVITSVAFHPSAPCLDIPGLPISPSREIEEGGQTDLVDASIHPPTAPPAFEEVIPSVKKKKGRPKPQREFAS